MLVQNFGYTSARAKCRGAEQCNLLGRCRRDIPVVDCLLVQGPCAPILQALKFLIEAPQLVSGARPALVYDLHFRGLPWDGIAQGFPVSV